jgi:hypothetical protein
MLGAEPDVAAEAVHAGMVSSSSDGEDRLPGGSGPRSRRRAFFANQVLC